MRIRVLGSSGSETPGHNSPAFLIDDSILLDAGTIGLSLKAGEESAIRYIFLTHAHLDHIKGIPFFLDNLVTRETGNTVTVMSAREVLRELKQNVFNDRIWPDFRKIPSRRRPVLRFRDISPARSVAVNGYRISMERVHHAVPAYGYIVEKRNGKSVAYTGDTGPTERFWKRMARHDVQLLILETSFPSRMEEIAVRSGHLTPALLRKELGKLPYLPRRIFVIHLKPQHQAEIEEEIRAIGRGKIEFQRDGDVVRI